MRVLVTGGAGYIGSHTCKALAQAGIEPIAYDNLSRGFRKAVKWGPLEEGDILDGDRLDAVIARYRPEALIHFAAFAYVGESNTEPVLYYRNNVTGSLTLFDAARRAGLNAIVFSSSCATYGVPESSPIAEDSGQNPINPYGRTKLMIEHALRDYAAAYPMRFAALRYFNAAGADPDGEIGENHDPETHALPLAIQAALGLGPEFRIFGDDYPTPDGTAIRDYIHVADLADAHVRAVRHLVSGGDSLAVNLGVGAGVSVRELVEAVSHGTGRKTPHTVGPRRPGDPPALVAAPGLAGEKLAWRPRYTDFAEIVSHAAAWLAKPVSERIGD